MKYLIIIFSVLFFNLSFSQQIRNGDFETWVHPQNFVYIPEYWTSLDLVIVGYSTTTQSFDAYSGISALRLSPIPSPNTNTKMTSSICLGTAKIDTQNYKLDYYFAGDSFTSKPEFLTGYYKYFPNVATNDSAYAKVYLKKGGTLDPWTDAVIGEGSFSFLSTSTYQKFNIPISKVNNNSVDSLVIAFFYSSKDTSQTPLGYLLIDNLGVEGTLKLENFENNDLFNIYLIQSQNKIIISNLANINVQSISIFDISGKLIKEYSEEKKVIDFSNMAIGYYILSIKTKEQYYSYKIHKN